MEPNEHSDGLIKALVATIFGLLGFVGLTSRRKKAVVVPIHSTEHFDRLVEIAKSLKELTDKFSGEIQKTFHEERVRLDGYQHRLHKLENAIIELQTQMTAILKVEIPCLWNDVHKIEENADGEGKKLSRLEGMIVRER